MEKKVFKLKNKIIAMVLVIITINLVLCGTLSNVTAALSVYNGDTIPKSEIRYKEGDNEFTYFPESYRENLKALHAKHPKWKFFAVYNKLDWYDSVSHESYEKGTAEYISTVPSSYSAIWKKDGKSYSVNGDSNWNIASKSAVAYCMDPRNWLSEYYIFQFETLNWTKLSKDDVAKVMKYFLPNMYNTKTYIGTDGKEVKMEKSYVDIIYEAGEENNVNPITIITKIQQEVGDFKADGTKNPSVSGDVSGYVGYYNFFNVNATDGSNAIRNGLAHAKNVGWDSPERSIKGGASILYNDYIKYGQNTAYNQKFDVTNIYGNAVYLYMCQYMTAIIAPMVQAQNVFVSYQKIGIVDSDFVFYIPVYENMPARAASLEDNTNITFKECNEKVKVIDCDGSSLVIRNGASKSSSAIEEVANGTKMQRVGTYSNGYSKVVLEDGTVGYAATQYLEVIKEPEKVIDVEKISLDKENYEIEVGEKLEYKVSVLPDNATNKKYTISSSTSDILKIDGTKITGQKEGETTVTVKSSKDGIVATAKVKVKPTEKKYEVDDKKLSIENDIINKIGTDTKVSSIKENIKLYNDSKIIIKDINGKELADGAIVGTGTTVSIVDKNGKQVACYTIVIKGDVNGDGKISAPDYVKIKNYIMGNGNLSDIQKKGADVSADTKVSAADYVKIKNHIMGVAYITN